MNTLHLVDNIKVKVQLSFMSLLTLFYLLNSNQDSCWRMIVLFKLLAEAVSPNSSAVQIATYEVARTALALTV